MSNLTDKRLEILRGFDGWNELCKIENKTEKPLIRRLFEIIDRYKTIDDLPTTVSVNRQEAIDSQWITRMRSIKKRFLKDHRGPVWFPILDEIATQHGWDSVFDPMDITAVFNKAKLRAIIARYKTPDCLPSGDATGKAKRADATWLKNMRGVADRSLKHILDKNGWPDIFSPTQKPYRAPEKSRRRIFPDQP
jgi:hypothetical protein